MTLVNALPKAHYDKLVCCCAESFLALLLVCFLRRSVFISTDKNLILEEW